MTDTTQQTTDATEATAPGDTELLRDAPVTSDDTSDVPDPEQSRIGVFDGDVDEAELNDELMETAQHLIIPLPEEGASEGEGELAPPQAAAQRRRRTHRESAVLLALTQKGNKEEGGGGNRNPYSRYFGYGPQYWCADFVSWAIDRTGNRDRKVPWGYPSGVRGITSWAKRGGHLKSTPQRGDIFTYKNGEHTGFVVSASGNRFTTIEGNTIGPDGRVIWVWSHVRRNDGSYHFVRFPE